MDQFFKETYEAPMVEVIGMKMESHLLTDSVKASDQITRSLKVRFWGKKYLSDILRFISKLGKGIHVAGDVFACVSWRILVGILLQKRKVVSRNHPHGI